MSTLREPSETRLAANEIQVQQKNKNKIVVSITLLSDCKDKDVKPKLEIKSEEIGYGKKGPAHDKFDYSKARYIHADGSVCQAEQRKHAEREMQLPDLPVTNVKTTLLTATDTCTDLNSEATTRQDLPVEMMTALKSTSLTVETTTTTTTENKVQEDGVSSASNNLNTGLNVETSPENNLDTPIETIDIALNVEMDLNTKKDGPVTGLNVETSMKDNTK